MSFEKLTWGVKASFRGYVEAAGGTTKVADGAEQNSNGEFVFKALPDGDLTIAKDGSATGTLRFQGTINFNAHGGMLNSTLAELALEATEDGLLLTVLEAPGNDSRCDIASLKLQAAGDDGALKFKTEITMDGMYQIADNYPPGTELDPLTLD